MFVKSTYLFQKLTKLFIILPPTLIFLIVGQHKRTAAYYKVIDITRECFTEQDHQISIGTNKIPSDHCEVIGDRGNHFEQIYNTPSLILFKLDCSVMKLFEGIKGGYYFHKVTKVRSDYG